MQDKKVNKVTSGFGKRLSALLEKQGITASELAKAVGTSHVAVGNWKNAGKIPNGEQAVKLARAFNVTMEWLLTGEGPRSNQEAMQLSMVESADKLLELANGDLDLAESIRQSITKPYYLREKELCAQIDTTNDALEDLRDHLNDQITNILKGRPLSFAQDVSADTLDTQPPADPAPTNATGDADHHIARHQLPLMHAAAGSPISSDDDWLETTQHWPSSRFAVQLHGDSMAPDHPDGTILIAWKKAALARPYLKKGQLYIFQLDQEKTLKRYNTRPATQAEIDKGLSYPSHQTGQPKIKQLESTNPDYQPIILHPDHDPYWLAWINPMDQPHDPNE